MSPSSPSRTRACSLGQEESTRPRRICICELALDPCASRKASLQRLSRWVVLRETHLLRAPRHTPRSSFSLPTTQLQGRRFPGRLRVLRGRTNGGVWVCRGVLSGTCCHTSLRTEAQIDSRRRQTTNQAANSCRDEKTNTRLLRFWGSLCCRLLLSSVLVSIASLVFPV